MKFPLRFSSVLLLSLVVLCGCKAVNAPLPAGAVDAIDANANEILQPAHAFALRISNAVQSANPQVHIVLTTPQKTVLEDLNKALNIADPFEIAYHATPTAAAATQLTNSSQLVLAAFHTAQTAITLP